MKRPTRHPVAFAALLLLVGCAGVLQQPGSGGRGDARVAGAALVANNVEIAYARLADERSGDADVRQFAERMRTDHGSLNASLTELLGALDLAAEDDSSGVALRDVSALRREQLRSLVGHAFDVAYLDAELASHRELLATIDRVLQPQARRPELREYVAALRPVVAAHIAHAEQLRATIAARRP